jgi:hypothetical protein
MHHIGITLVGLDLLKSLLLKASVAHLLIRSRRHLNRNYLFANPIYSK